MTMSEHTQKYVPSEYCKTVALSRTHYYYIIYSGDVIQKNVTTPELRKLSLALLTELEQNNDEAVKLCLCYPCGTLTWFML